MKNGNYIKKGRADEFELRNLVRIFLNKKWWFIGTFIVILVGGILFSLLRTPQYGLSSRLLVESIARDRYEILMEYFPEKTDKLISINNLTEEEKLKSDELLEEVLDNLDYPSLTELKDSIYISVEKGGVLVITTVNKEREKTYDINKTLLELYGTKRNTEINQYYDDLLESVEGEISSIQGEIEDLSEEAGEDDALAGEKIELRYETYYNLEESRDLLIENKDFFTNRIKVSIEPELNNVYSYYNIKRDLVFSLFAAIALGIIAAFAANYFQSLKRK